VVDGASRESQSAAVDRLDTLVATLDDAALGTLATDLAGVAALLESQYALRRALADPGRDAAERVALLTGLLTGKVGTDAVDVLGGVVRARWSTGADLVETVSLLAANATLALAASRGVLDGVEDELFRFARVLAGNAELALALSSSSVEPAQKSQIVQRLLAGKAEPETVSLVEQALADSRGKALDRSLDEFLRLAAARRQRLVAVVRAAVLPTEAQLTRLAAAVGRIYGHDVRVEVEIAPELIGGMVVTVGGELLDGSVLHRLELAKRALARD
jgi:F-type H+-transporting ATPase subunit delta